MSIKRLSIVLLLVCGLIWVAAPGWGEDDRVALVADLSDTVSPAMAQFAARVIDEAEERTQESGRAEAVVFMLDTPGGLADAMRDMVQYILASKVPVIVYVAPQGSRAASAGVMITIAAHVAAMAPGTNIGAAHPVQGGGKDIGGTMGLKVTNDLVAYTRSLADQRGRNADWAEEAIREAASLPALEAAAEGVVDVVAPNLESLLDWADGREVELVTGSAVLKTKGAQIVYRHPSFRDRLLGVIANPNLAYLLLMIGLMALYFEFSHPGAVFPGVVGAIALILAFFAMQTLPLSYAGLLLIILGVVLFIIELKVTSYGLLTIAGIACLFLGSIMIFDSPEEGLRLAWSTILPTVIFVSAFFVGVILLVWRAQRRKPATGPGGLLMERGKVMNWAGGQGKVFIHGEIWRAEGEAELHPGEEVVVVGGEGLNLKVRPAKKED